MGRQVGLTTPYLIVPIVRHYCKSDEFRAGFKVAEWRVFFIISCVNVARAMLSSFA